MKILFLGGLYPKELYNKIYSRSKRSFQIAANNLQWAFIEGLDTHYDDLTILTAPFISSFPIGYKDLHFRGIQFSHNNIANDKCISFINTPFTRSWSIKRNLKRELRMWCSSNSERKCIVIYSLQAHLMTVASEVKKEFSDLIICQIVADLPQYMGVNLVYKKLGLQIKALKIINICLKNIDCFVLLSESMKDKLDVKDRPYVRIEGIYQNRERVIKFKKTTKKIILYTGALSNNYGLSNLLGAFSMIESSEFLLWFCGDGEMKDKIIEKTIIDRRIKYFGTLPFEKVKILQQRVTVLINPRTSEGDFTKYSFPSKTMEYLASGTPTIMYYLPAVPDEYYQYIYVPKDESIECLKQTIIEVCSKPREELNLFGEKASQFILSRKNPKIQVQKIYEMLENI